jgi:hypothetical protein
MRRASAGEYSMPWMEPALDLLRQRHEFGAQVGIGLVAGSVPRALLEQLVERGRAVLAAGRDHLVGRRHAIEHQRAHRLRVGARICLRQARAVRAAPQVDRAVAERAPHFLDVAGGIGGGVVLERRLRFLDAGADLLVLLGLAQFVFAGIGFAIELARQAGAALVDEDDVAGGARALEGGGQQLDHLAAGLAGAAGKDEQRIGPRRLAERGGHRHVQLERAGLRLRIIQRDRNGHAAQRLLGTRQVAAAAGCRRAGRTGQHEPEGRRCEQVVSHKCS